LTLAYTHTHTLTHKYGNHSLRTAVGRSADSDGSEWAYLWRIGACNDGTVTVTAVCDAIADNGGGGDDGDGGDGSGGGGDGGGGDGGGGGGSDGDGGSGGVDGGDGLVVPDVVGNGDVISAGGDNNGDSVMPLAVGIVVAVLLFVAVVVFLLRFDGAARVKGCLGVGICKNNRNNKPVGSITPASANHYLPCLCYCARFCQSLLALPLLLRPLLPIITCLAFAIKHSPTLYSFFSYLYLYQGDLDASRDEGELKLKEERNEKERAITGKLRRKWKERTAQQRADDRSAGDAAKQAQAYAANNRSVTLTSPSFFFVIVLCSLRVAVSC
jgi:hypothetical protein